MILQGIKKSEEINVWMKKQTELLSSHYENPQLFAHY